MFKLQVKNHIVGYDWGWGIILWIFRIHIYLKILFSTKLYCTLRLEGKWKSVQTSALQTMVLGAAWVGHHQFQLYVAASSHITAYITVRSSGHYPLPWAHHIRPHFSHFSTTLAGVLVDMSHMLFRTKKMFLQAFIYLVNALI